MGCGCGNFSYCTDQCYLCNCQQTCYNNRHVADYATCAALCLDNSIVPEGQDLTLITYSGEAGSWPTPGESTFFSWISSCLPGLSACLSGCTGDYTSCDDAYASCLDAADSVYSGCVTACAGSAPCIAGCSAAQDAAYDSCYSTAQSCFQPIYDDEIACRLACNTSNEEDIKLALKSTGTDCAQTNCFGETIGAGGDSLSQCLLNAIDTSVESAWTPLIAYASEISTCEGSYSSCRAGCGRTDGACQGDCDQSLWDCAKHARGDYLDDLTSAISTKRTSQATCDQLWLCKKIDGEKPRACFCDHTGDLKLADGLCDAAWIGVEADLQRCLGDCPFPGSVFADEYLGDDITCIGLCNVAAIKGNFDAEAGRLSARTQSCKSYFPESAHHQMGDACRAYCSELSSACQAAFAEALASCINTCCSDAGCISDCASAWELGPTDCNSALDSCLSALTTGGEPNDDIIGLYDCMATYSACVFGASICNAYDCSTDCNTYFPLGDCPDCGAEGREFSDGIACLPDSYDCLCDTPPRADDYTCD
jgi:hypothetical protein